MGRALPRRGTPSQPRGSQEKCAANAGPWGRASRRRRKQGERSAVGRYLLVWRGGGSQGNKHCRGDHGTSWDRAAAARQDGRGALGTPHQRSPSAAAPPRGSQEVALPRDQACSTATQPPRAGQGLPRVTAPSAEPRPLHVVTNTAPSHGVRRGGRSSGGLRSPFKLQ